MEGETWKEIQDFEGRYAVSNFGNIKCLAKCNSWNGRCWEEAPLKQHDLKGYRVVWLRKPGNIHQKFSVHRLVAIAFIPNPENKAFVNHINKDRSDNRISNLEWCTHAENMDHRDNYQGPPDDPINVDDIPF